MTGDEENTRISETNNIIWVGDSGSHSSVVMYCVFHGNNLISWSCEQQQIISLYNEHFYSCIDFISEAFKKKPEKQ